MITFERAFNNVCDGWLYKSEAQLLWETALGTTGPILEVGCYRGRSTILLAQLDRQMYCVDPFNNNTDGSGEEIYQCFRNNMAHFGFENVLLFREMIENWKPHPVGFAYLDGDHSYEGTMVQIQVARQCGAEAICIHDYATSGGGAEVKRAVEDSGLEVIRWVERMVSVK